MCFGGKSKKLKFKRGCAYSASTPRPPPFYYMPQVQGLMAIFGRSWCHLWCWTPVHGASLYTIPADPAYWVACVREGTVIYEIGGVEEEIARGALMRVANKMPYRCRFVKRRHGI